MDENALNVHGNRVIEVRMDPYPRAREFISVLQRNGGRPNARAGLRGSRHPRSWPLTRRKTARKQLFKYAISRQMYQLSPELTRELTFLSTRASRDFSSPRSGWSFVSSTGFGLCFALVMELNIVSITCDSIARRVDMWAHA